MKKFFFPGLLSLLIFSCSVSKRLPANDVPINGLKYIGQYEVPLNMQFKGTTVGGLSGIDYDPKTDQYYLICDDRSDINPARFYTASIKIVSSGITNVQFLNVTTLLRKDGSPFPPSKKDKAHSADPEALRYDPKTNEMIWTSEGERIVKGDTALQDPSITMMHTNGRYIDTFPLPAQMHMNTFDIGLRKNSTFEGLAFADNFKTMYISVEEPLFQDGPHASLQPADVFTRIIKYDMASHRPGAQYAYPLEPVAHPAKPEGEFMINGIPDIMSVGKNKLLVIERSFSTGIQACTIRVYLTDLSRASDISGLVSLIEQRFKQPVEKKLLLNMDDLGIYIDNIEGVTFGPTLPNGHRTMIFVSDNNFDKKQKTQFLLFEVL